MKCLIISYIITHFLKFSFVVNEKTIRLTSIAEEHLNTIIKLYFNKS